MEVYMKDYVNWAILAPGIIANSMAAAITGTAKKDSRIKANKILFMRVMYD